MIKPLKDQGVAEYHVALQKERISRQTALLKNLHSCRAYVGDEIKVLEAMKAHLAVLKTRVIKCGTKSRLSNCDLAQSSARMRCFRSDGS